MESKKVIRSLAALAQPHRLAIFRLLVQAGGGGMSVGSIGQELDVAPATLSFHLKELTNAGLIEARQESRFIYYSAAYAQMNDLLAYLTENCCAREGTSCGPVCADVASGRPAVLQAIPTECTPAAAGTAKAKRSRGAQTTRRAASARPVLTKR